MMKQMERKIKRERERKWYVKLLIIVNKFDVATYEWANNYLLVECQLFWYAYKWIGALLRQTKRNLPIERNAWSIFEP